MNVQFKKGVLELCVLTVVARRDCYGYELVEEISRSIDIAEGTIYPLLRRLHDENCFATYLKESGEGPPRKYYRITPHGRTVLIAMRAEWDGFVVGVDDILRETNSTTTVSTAGKASDEPSGLPPRAGSATAKTPRT